MDPNEALRRLREALAQWHLRGDMAGALDAAATIADQAHALDEWLSKGGFLPRAWEASTTTTRAVMTARGE